MSGLFGFSNGKDPLGQSDRTVFEGMSSAICAHRTSPGAGFFQDDVCIAGQVQSFFLKNKNTPAIADDMRVWIDGEFFEQRIPDPAAYCIDRYRETRSFEFLRDIDGVFSAVLYDVVNKKVHLITDRYGLQYLYWSSTGGRFCWAPQVKSFLGLPWLNPCINREAVNHFIRRGEFPGEATWFNEVTLVPWGSVVSYDLRSKTAVSKRYWHYDELIGKSTSCQLIDCRDRLGELFARAVAKRCLPAERICIGLSGGLDSRAILAALPPNAGLNNVYSFGKENSLDITLAKAAARVRNIPHQTITINAGNWFQPRIGGIWRSDGMLDCLHMHGIEALPLINEQSDVELNGYLGDALLGGGAYGTDLTGMFQRVINPGRRRIRAALLLCEPYIHVRMPFIDNDLLSFIVTVSPSLRKHSRIYNAMLLARYPAYYKTIAWQKAGVPISFPPAMVRAGIFAGKIMNRLGPIFPFVKSKRSFTDYASWIRAEPAWSGFRKVLDNPRKLSAEYVDPKSVTTCMREHSEGKGRSAILCRYFTLELWLQQAFNKRWRDFAELTAE